MPLPPAWAGLPLHPEAVPSVVYREVFPWQEGQLFQTEPWGVPAAWLMGDHLVADSLRLSSVFVVVFLPEGGAHSPPCMLTLPLVLQSEATTSA